MMGRIYLFANFGLSVLITACLLFITAVAAIKSGCTAALMFASMAAVGVAMVVYQYKEIVKTFNNNN